MKNKKYQPFLYVAVAVTVLVLVFVFIDKRHHKPQPQKPTTVSIAPSGIRYPAGWQEQSRIGVTDKSSGVVSEALYNNTATLITVRVDNGTLPQNFNIQKTTADTISKLKGSLDGFVLVSQKITKIGDNQAIILTYDEVNGSFNYRQTQIIVPTSDKTFYLTISGLKTDISKLSPADINSITDAFATYIAAHQ